MRPRPLHRPTSVRPPILPSTPPLPFLPRPCSSTQQSPCCRSSSIAAAPAQLVSAQNAERRFPLKAREPDARTRGMPCHWPSMSMLSHRVQLLRLFRELLLVDGEFPNARSRAFPFKKFAHLRKRASTHGRRGAWGEHAWRHDDLILRKAAGRGLQ